MRAFLYALLSAVALVLAGCNDDSGSSPPAQQTTPPVTVPAATPRTDTLYCYYGTWDGQAQAVAAHTNCGWAGPQWGVPGTDATANRLRELRDSGNRCAILDVLMTYGEGGEAGVRAYFDSLQRQGLLGDYICALYPADEPDARGLTAEQIVAGNMMLRRVALDYPFIAHIPLYSVYTCHGGYPGVESFDWVSVDDYDSKAGVIAKCIAPLKAKLRPEQRLWLTPGAFQCDDIQTFYDYMQRDPQVLGISAFIWRDGWDGTTNARGLESQPCRASYEAVGHLIKGNP